MSVRMIDGGQPQQRGDGIGMAPPKPPPTRLAWHGARDENGSDTTDITFVFIFLFGFGFEYG